MDSKIVCKKPGCEHREPFKSLTALKMHEGWTHNPEIRKARIAGLHSAQGKALATKAKRRAAGVYSKPAALPVPVVATALRLTAARKAQKLAAAKAARPKVRGPYRKQRKAAKVMPTELYCRFCPRCGENIAILERAAHALRGVTHE